MRFEGTSAYIATDDLKVAVNAATMLRRPLLVKGEPGTGKTVLAEEIAKAFDAPLITSAALMSFAHGANDISNAIGPVAAIVDALGHTDVRTTLGYVQPDMKGMSELMSGLSMI